MTSARLRTYLTSSVQWFKNRYIVNVKQSCSGDVHCTANQENSNMTAVKFLLFTILCIFGSKADVATDEFTGDLLRAIYTSDDGKQNTVVSAVSLYDVTALLQQGSGGNSEQELTKVLHADSPTTRQRYTQLVRSLKADHSETQLEFANKVYLENSFRIEPTFRSIATQDFQADIDNIEFRNHQQASDTINQWVSDSTHGKITDLISPDAISDNTAMVLLNAVFFAGNWTRQFDAYATQNSSFTTLERQVRTVPTMHLSEMVVAGEIEALDAKFVRLPFRGDEFSMIFVVPNTVDGLSALIDGVQQDHLESILGATDRRNVDLSLPKFKFSTTSHLVPTLQKLGLSDIFSQAASNLTGITRSPPLYVSDVTQKATIEVDERGATAAAATSAVFTEKIFVGHVIDSLEVVADHPFMFLISYDKYKLPIFCGWIVRP